jgi:LDH2 family malate/lactate/ureidoglycolate dehydrogenase
VPTPVGIASRRALTFLPVYCNGLYFVFRPDLFVEREVFDTHVTQLLIDLESSTSATNSTLRFPGEESQRQKAEILSSGILSIEEPTYTFLCS